MDSEKQRPEHTPPQDNILYLLNEVLRQNRSIIAQNNLVLQTNSLVLKHISQPPYVIPIKPKQLPCSECGQSDGGHLDSCKNAIVLNHMTSMVDKANKND